METFIDDLLQKQCVLNYTVNRGLYNISNIVSTVAYRRLNSDSENKKHITFCL